MNVLERIEVLQKESAEGREALNQEIRKIDERVGSVLDRLDGTDMALTKQIRSLQILVVVLTIVTIGVVAAFVAFL